MTNQVINVFLELGLPFILRFVNDWRAGKTTLKQAVSREEEKPATTEDESERRFLEKVESELELPDYALFSASNLRSLAFGSVLKS